MGRKRCIEVVDWGEGGGKKFLEVRFLDIVGAI